jgi:hypothetical protein
MHFASNLPHPWRSMAIPLMAAAVLGAGIATATFALVNIEDEPIVSLPTPAVESAAVPSDAVAGQRNDGGPAEGAAQRILGPETAQASTATAAAAGTAGAVGIPSPAAAAKMNAEAGSGTASKDEAGTAAAISQSNDIEQRGSKASATGSGSSDTTIQSDPQGDKP